MSTKKLKSMEEVLEAIECMITSIGNMDERALLINWLKQFSRYKAYERDFNPKKLKKYNFGDLIEVDFGYNVGRELRGPHFAVVVENNPRSKPTIMVVPLSSYMHNKKESAYDIDLGIISSLNSYKDSNGIGSRALPDQMKAIDKIRIYYPKRNYETLGRIPREVMKLIYDRINMSYCDYDCT